MARKKRGIRSTAKLTTLDDFLGEEGKRDEFEAIAVKEVLAWQIEQAMKEKNISQQPGPAYEDIAQSDWATARPKGRKCHANHASARRAYGRAVVAVRIGLRSQFAIEAEGEVPVTAPMRRRRLRDTKKSYHAQVLL